MTTKKVLAIIGSPHEGETYKAVETFERELKSMEAVDFEYVWLKDLDLGTCRGCFLCFSKGEKSCPMKDDRDLLFDKIAGADGVVFATPNYALQVTAIMKNFYDRFAFVFHRPCFFYKAATSIVTQGVYGGGDIVKYIDTVSEFWGFRVSKGISLTAPPEVRLPEAQRKIDLQISRSVKNFYSVLNDPGAYTPSLKRFAIFHAARTSIEISADRNGADYNYFKDKGWFESDFYCEAKLNPAQKVLGSFLDIFIRRQAVKDKQQKDTHEFELEHNKTGNKSTSQARL